jgi:hypothetical protein
MNKNTTKILSDIESSSKILRECKMRKCESQVIKGNEQLKQVKEKTRELLNLLISKKLPFDKFVKQTNDLKKKLQKTKETKALQACTVKECESNTKNMLSSMIAIKTYDCTVENKKKACKIEKKAKKILDKKKLKQNDFAKFVQLISK